MSAPSEWRSSLTRLRRSYHARLGAFGAVFAIAIAACGAAVRAGPGARTGTRPGSRGGSTAGRRWGAGPRAIGRAVLRGVEITGERVIASTSSCTPGPRLMLQPLEPHGRVITTMRVRVRRRSARCSVAMSVNSIRGR